MPSVQQIKYCSVRTKVFNTKEEWDALEMAPIVVDEGNGDLYGMAWPVKWPRSKWTTLKEANPYGDAYRCLFYIKDLKTFTEGDYNDMSFCENCYCKNCKIDRNKDDEVEEEDDDDKCMERLFQ